MERELSSAVELRPTIGPNERTGGPMRSLAEKRAATLKASAHIITAVMGPEVLSLGFAMSQLGWVLGPAATALLALLIYSASTILEDCYDDCRSPSPPGAPTAGGSRYTYMDAIKENNLPAGGGIIKARFCVVLLYANMVAFAVSYTITASNAMTAMTKRSKCFEGQYYYGEGEPSNNSSPHSQQARYMAIFGVAQILLSLIIQGFDRIGWLSVLAAAMSLTYAAIGLGLGIAQVVANKGFKGTLTGMLSIGGVTPTGKAWRGLQALGAIAVAFSYSHVLLDVRGTIRGAEARAVMRGATRLSAAVTAVLYTLGGVVGYAAFGVTTTAPQDLLFLGFCSPAWVLHAARAAAAVHLAGAYQVCCQPLFAFAEDYWAQRRWPQPRCIITKHNWLLRLTFRTAFVVVTTVASSIMLPSPLAQDVLIRFPSALAFWPLTVYFPIDMHIARNKLHKWSPLWVALKLISLFCFLITAATAVGCLADRTFSGEH